MDQSRLALPLILLIALGCTREESSVAPAEAAPAAQPIALSIESALESPNRFAGDAAEDARRKSSEVLAFMQLSAGAHVLDYFAGGGYYTELLSTLVGPEGRVYAYNNAEYAKYAGDVPARRYADNRLANVTELNGTPEALEIERGTLDAVLFAQSLHDLYWRSKDGSWRTVAVPQALERVVSALKPGGNVIVVDHVAAAGSDPAVSVDALHRIDPAVVKRDLEAAGLVLEAESAVFANAADDHTVLVFDESIRHRTDQFMYRFRKPSN